MNLRQTFVFRHRDFGLFWFGMMLVGIAAQIQSVTIGWQIYGLARETRSIAESAFLVGMVGLAEFVPLFVLTLYAGILADRMNRKTIVVVSLFVQLLCLFGLLGVALETEPKFLHLYIIAGMFGASRAFLSPAGSALTPMLVPRADMPQAISLKSLSWQAAVIIGPWIGGLLCAISVPASYGFASALFAIGLITCLFIRGKTTPTRQPGSRWQQLKEGLHYTWTNKIVFGAISLDLFAVLLGGAVSLLPAFATDILKVGPEGFGILRSGPAIGAALVAIWLARYPLKSKAGSRMFLAVAAFGLATIVFGLSKNMWLSVAALAVLGGADMVSVYVRQTLIQIVTPDHMRGRVSSVSGLFISGSNELGDFESGVVARFLGPVGAAVFGGIGTLIVTGAWIKMFPALARADRLDEAEDAEAAAPQPQSTMAAASPPL